MLCPHLLDAQNDIVAVANLSRRITAFTRSLGSVDVGKLSPQPSWLDSVTAEIGRAQEAADQWRTAKPEIIAPAVGAYMDYRSRFEGIARTIPLSSDRATWTAALGRLKKQLTANATTVLQAQAKMAEVRDALTGIHAELQAALQRAEDAHEKEHEALTDLKGKTVALTSRLTQLTDEVTSPDIEAGKTLFDTVAKVSLPVFTQTGEAIPFLSIVFSVISVGKSMYTLIQTDQEIRETLDQLREAMGKQAQEIQALALTHGLADLLQSLDESNHQALEKFPELARMWTNEADKVGGVIDALATGSDPQLNTSLVAMDPAVATWNTLADLAENIVTRSEESGGTVELSTARG
jgi:hypothetical protein